MEVPDAIIAFKLLDNAGLSQSNHQLALTAWSDLKFDTTKSALNRIFASKSQNVPEERDTVVTVKEESAFVSDGYYQRGQSSRRHVPCNGADRSINFTRLKTKMNPVFNGNYNEKGLTSVLAVHVDDFLCAGSSSFKESVVSRIRDMFKVGKESCTCESFKYLGLDLSQENETIVLNQKEYVRILKTVLIDKDRVKPSPLSSSEQTLLR
ncbi:unnamed protein product [Mytilus edulis]|uniref:Reverse transcriptase Ty1/copia-type domain-containing protein n=1 Tax=Mytilus edulis TaxID=6550 RepID=A0A8S3USD1_MYTED|nr:unnamed protein product [Mytilus edulis]